MDTREIIKSLCKEKGMTLSGLEKELNYGNGSLKKSANIRADRVTEIAKYFNVSTDFLLTGKNSKGVKIKVLGKVQAGIPVEAIQDVIGEEEITEELAKTGEFFGLKIKGDSMSPRIEEGDIVIVKKQSDVETGDIAIVLINGNDATCKKIKKTETGIMLMPFNPSYDPLFFTNEEIEKLPISIIGKVVELRAKF